MGAIERGGKVYAKVVPNRRKETIKEMIFPAIEKGTVVHTDEFPAYVYRPKTANSSTRLSITLRNTWTATYTQTA